tara:strand:- start:60 stop:242 length:183 start_codon:yes stop_codon:yes gene_type:complete
MKRYLTPYQKTLKFQIESILFDDPSASYTKIKSLCTTKKNIDLQLTFEKAYKSLKKRNLI